MVAASPPAPARDNPVLKWIMGAVQVLFVTFLTWIGGNIATSIREFSGKLDGLVTSIAAITLEQQLQKRDVQEYVKRLTKVESSIETLEKRLERQAFQLERLEGDRKGGR